MVEDRRYNRPVHLRMASDQYAALERLVERGQYESPAHAIRRAIVMLLAFHGESVDDRREAA